MGPAITLPLAMLKTVLGCVRDAVSGMVVAITPSVLKPLMVSLAGRVR